MPKHPFANCPFFYGMKNSNLIGYFDDNHQKSTAYRQSIPPRCVLVLTYILYVYVVFVIVERMLHVWQSPAGVKQPIILHVLHRQTIKPNHRKKLYIIGYYFILIQYLHKMWVHHCIKFIILSIRSTKGLGLAFQKNREINNLSMINHMWNYWNARVGPFLGGQLSRKGPS